MPTKMFCELKEEKRGRILDACIEEFARYGYENSSTNRIVQKAGISKGSLFKYFENKEELFLFVFESVATEMLQDMGKRMQELPEDLFERVIQYSELEFLWYIKYPEKCKLLLHAISENDSTIKDKISEKYRLEGTDYYDNILKDVDISHLRRGREKTMALLKWVLAGFKEEFLASMEFIDHLDIEQIKKQYVEQLRDYLEIIKEGLVLKED